MTSVLTAPMDTDNSPSAFQFSFAQGFFERESKLKLGKTGEQELTAAQCIEKLSDKSVSFVDKKEMLNHMTGGIRGANANIFFRRKIEQVGIIPVLIGLIKDATCDQSMNESQEDAVAASLDLLLGLNSQFQNTAIMDSGIVKLLVQTMENHPDRGRCVSMSCRFLIIAGSYNGTEGHQLRTPLAEVKSKLFAAVVEVMARNAKDATVQLEACQLLINLEEFEPTDELRERALLRLLNVWRHDNSAAPKTFTDTEEDEDFVGDYYNLSDLYTRAALVMTMLLPVENDNDELQERLISSLVANGGVSVLWQAIKKSNQLREHSEDLLRLMLDNASSMSVAQHSIVDELEQLSVADAAICKAGTNANEDSSWVAGLLETMRGNKESLGIMKAAFNRIARSPSTASKLEFKRQGGVKLLVEAMHDHGYSASLLAKACSTLAALATTDDAFVESNYWVEVGAIQSVLESTRQHKENHAVQQEGFRALCNFVAPADSTKGKYQRDNLLWIKYLGGICTVRRYLRANHGILPDRDEDNAENEDEAASVTSARAMAEKLNKMLIA